MGQLLSNLNEDEPPRRETRTQRPPAARGGGEAAAATRRRDRRGRMVVNLPSTCSKCGESIYAGQHRTRWRYQYHTYRCPDAETNAVIRALAPEHDWINAPEPPTMN